MDHLFTLRLKLFRSLFHVVNVTRTGRVTRMTATPEPLEAARIILSKQGPSKARGSRFELQRVPASLIVVKAWEKPDAYNDGHRGIELEVRHGGKVIFPRGVLYCGVPAGTSIEGVAARELALSTVGMRPGDTDEEYFASYTPEQRAWALEYGDAISTERSARYCNPETGEVRS